MEKHGNPIMRMENISKSFGAIRAVQHVDVELCAGEVIGLVGDNGSGKTTLMKVLSGIYQPNEGKIYIDGKDVRFEHRLAARNLGIEMVYQDLGLCFAIDIAENMFMGRELVKGFLGLRILDKRKMHAEAVRCLTNIGVNFPSTKTRVKNLSGGQQKAIAVERSVYWDTKITIMDEPTAALGVKEQSKVLEIITNLKERGIGVIFISHNLEEIFSVADRIVVLSRGRKVADVIRTETSKDQIVTQMIA
jgi:ABC-type sugar transport system ATPase subunit